MTGSVSATAAAAGGYDKAADDKGAAARAGRGRGSHASGTSWRVLRGQVCERGTGSRRSWTLGHACSSVRWLACL